jgi:hypothetical protein
VDQKANIGDGRLRICSDTAKQGFGLFGIGHREVIRRISLERDSGKNRPQPIVEVATQTPAFFFAASNQQPPRALELNGLLRGMHRRSGQLGYRRQQTFIFAREGVILPARRDLQAPDFVVLIVHW